MAKKPSLASFKPTARLPLTVVAPEPVPAPNTEALPKAKKPVRRAELSAAVPAVVSKKKATFEIHPDAAHQLAVLKLETNKSKNDLVSEALNMLFKKHGKPIIQ